MRERRCRRGCVLLEPIMKVEVRAVDSCRAVVRDLERGARADLRTKVQASAVAITGVRVPPQICSYVNNLRLMSQAEPPFTMP